MAEQEQGRVTYRAVLRVPEFRAMVLAHALSILGDQVSRFAVAALVLERTGSAFAAAATFAISYLTWLVGGPFLSSLADRFPRKRVMVVCDLLRAGLVGSLVLPGVPLPVVFAVLVAVGLLSPPFESARSATLPDVLTGDRYVVGSALVNTNNQVGQVAGFLLGGALVVTLSPQGALAVDALTFLVSALVLLRWVRPRPAAPRRAGATMLKDTREGLRVVLRDRALRRYMAYGVLCAGVTIAPEGLALSVARGHGDGELGAAVLIAAVPLGFVLGATVVGRLPEATRLRLLPWLLALCVVPQLATPFAPATAVVAGLWLAAGLGTVLQLVAAAAFMTATPDHARGRAFGVAATGVMGIQGLALLAAGALAEVVDPSTAVALLALPGLVGLLLLQRDARSAQEDGESCRVPTR